MIRASTAIMVLALGAVAVGACKQEATATPLDVRAAMQNGVNPATLAIWDVGNDAMNDAGGIDPAKMDDAKWSALADAAGKLSASARTLAGGTSFGASAPDNTAVGEGEIAMAEVQKHLDADPPGFAQMAAALSAHADKLATAAKAKDAAAASDLVSRTDQVCESCHMQFWYPE